MCICEQIPVNGTSGPQTALLFKLEYALFTLGSSPPADPLVRLTLKCPHSHYGRCHRPRASTGSSVHDSSAGLTSKTPRLCVCVPFTVITSWFLVPRASILMVCVCRCSVPEGRGSLVISPRWYNTVPGPEEELTCMCEEPH